DLYRRAQVSQAANERYLEALAAVQDTTPLWQLAEPLCRAVPEPTRRPTAVVPTPTAEPAAVVSTPTAGPARRPPPPPVRALNPLAADDAALLEAVSRHEFLLNGLRNRDLRLHLFGADPTDATARRRRAAAVTRKLRPLRGHGLLHKVPKSHRYVVSEAG